jgi:hypothetical protein
MDIIGAMPKEVQQQFNAWLMSLTKPKRQLVMDALPELDSEEELLGLLSLDPKVRIEMLPALKERKEERLRVQQTLAGIGEAVKKAALDGARIMGKAADGAYGTVGDAITAVKEFDDSLAPMADRLEQECASAWRSRPRRKRVPWSFWKIIGF